MIAFNFYMYFYRKALDLIKQSQVPEIIVFSVTTWINWAPHKQLKYLTLINVFIVFMKNVQSTWFN